MRIHTRIRSFLLAPEIPARPLVRWPGRVAFKATPFFPTTSLRARRICHNWHKRDSDIRRRKPLAPWRFWFTDAKSGARRLEHGSNPCLGFELRNRTEMWLPTRDSNPIGCSKGMCPRHGSLGRARYVQSMPKASQCWTTFNNLQQSFGAFRAGKSRWLNS